MPYRTKQPSFFNKLQEDKKKKERKIKGEPTDFKGLRININQMQSVDFES